MPGPELLYSVLREKRHQFVGFFQRHSGNIRRSIVTPEDIDMRINDNMAVLLMLREEMFQPFNLQLAKCPLRIIQADIEVFRFVFSVGLPRNNTSP